MCIFFLFSVVCRRLALYSGTNLQSECFHSVRENVVVEIDFSCLAFYHIVNPIVFGVYPSHGICVVSSGYPFVDLGQKEQSSAHDLLISWEDVNRIMLGVSCQSSQEKQDNIPYSAKGRDDHVYPTFATRCVLLLIKCCCFAVFSFSENLSSFALASKARLLLHYSHLWTHFFSMKHKRDCHVCSLP